MILMNETFSNSSCSSAAAVMTTKNPPANNNIPKELLHIILEYDGKIKYRNGKYINCIDKNDGRYDIIKPLLIKKKEILKTITLDGEDFYFEFRFEKAPATGLCYDLGFNFRNRFEICYYDFRAEWGSGLDQIRTYIL